MGIWEMNAGQLMKAGGPLMWLLLLCSVAAVAVVVEKFLYLAGIRTDSRKLKADVFALVKDNRVPEAVNRCQSDPSPLAKILKAGILNSGQPRDRIKEAMEEVSLIEIPRLEHKLTALSTIAQVAPLLGLLGTVAGLCSAFYTIQVRSAGMYPVTPGDIAGGIWEALLTTAAGLAVAVPTFIVYHFLASRVNHMVLEMEQGATELLNLLGHIDEVNRAGQEEV